jgi:hypothetical protein
LEKKFHTKTNIDINSTILALVLSTYIWLSIQNSSNLPDQSSSTLIREPIGPKDHLSYRRLWGMKKNPVQNLKKNLENSYKYIIITTIILIT